jgi:shikimate kinase / 3-dehydroquinate synthase
MRPVFLTGFMATGKSTVGRAAADLLGVPFRDLDARIEEAAGMSVGEMFRSAGEERFRALERQLLDEELADPTPRVVALGGGALLDREPRLRALRSGCVVTLTARPDVIAERSARSGGTRPLLAVPDAGRRIEQLLASRTSAYAECHAILDGSTRSPESLAEEIRRVEERGDIVVALGERTYPVRVTSDASALREVAAQLGARGALLVTDSNVAPHVTDELAALGELVRRNLVLDPGEGSKSVEGLVRGWQAAQDASLDRSGLVIGLGGGVVTDLAGLVAATWLRGVRWIAAPTTLLSMVDAAIGGKTAIDFGAAKNSVGVFHQPSAVVANVARCASEPLRSFRSGCAEVVKTALLGDRSLFERMEAAPARYASRDPSAVLDAVRSSAAVKAAIVSRDEREGDERALLNLGHTLGHAIEAAGGFTRWMHGEAVAIGTVAALRAGARMGLTPPDLPGRVTSLLASLGLPVSIPRAELEASLPFLVHDKKRESDSVRFVYVSSLGEARWQRLPIRELAGLFRDATEPST